MYLPMLAALLSTTSIYSPEVEKRGISTIKATGTVADVVSVASIVAGLVSIITKIDVLTTTTTTTRYTSTFTSTIFGESINFVSVVDSSHAPANIPSSTSIAPIESSSSGTSAEAAPTTSPGAKTAPETSTAAETTSSTSPGAKTAPETSTAESKPLSSENTTLLPSSTNLKPIFVSSTSLTPSTTYAPATTAAPSSSSTKAPSSQKPDSESDSDWGTVLPSTTDGYVLEAVLTSMSGSVCIVDYHYYLTDSTMTVTSVSTIYSTTTLV